MKKHSLPHHIAIAMGLGAIGFLIVIALGMNSIRAGTNKLALQDSKKVIEQKLESLREPVRKFARDYNNWDDIYKATQRNDIPFIADNYGVTAIYGDMFDGAMMFDGPFQSPISWVRGGSKEPGGSILSDRAVAAIRKSTLGEQPGVRKTFDFLVIDSGKLQVYSASTIFPESSEMFGSIDQRHRTIAVLRKTIDQADFDAIESELEIKGVVLSDAAVSEGAIPLQGFDGQPIGYLNWNPPKSGDAIVFDLLPIFGLTIAAILIASSVGITALYLRARSLIESESRETARARTDDLTTLPNRLAFLEHLEEHLSCRAKTLAVIAIDLNGFKRINDLIGHLAGDSVLAEFGLRLKGFIESGVFVARLGGDEFVAVIHSENGLEGEIERCAAKLRENLQRPFILNGHVFFLSASQGLAVKASKEEAASSLIRKADQAMYFAKETGVTDLVRYEEAIRDSAESQRELEIEFHGAVDRVDEFSIAYQPIVAAHTRDLVRAEALARWRNPRLGDISPAVFIGVAEKSGLITKLGWIIIDKVIADLSVYSNLSVSINISPLQLLQHNFASDLLNRFRRSNVSTSRIQLEVTESVAIQNPERVSICLSELILGGFSVALDDFGTGFSSLSYVHQMPFSCLKVDRSFVSGSLEQVANARLINSIVHMGHALEKTIVAEGVETLAQAWELEKSGCDLLQGFFFGRPESILSLVAKYPNLSHALVA